MITIRNTGSPQIHRIRSKVTPLVASSFLDDVLYLDTARLGRISASARQALTDAIRLSQAFGASTYFDQLLFGGYDQLRARDEYSGLKDWQGIDNLRSDFRRFMFGANIGEVVFASRTANLMAIAAKLLFSRCRNVLVTDLNWQPYIDILSAAIPNESCKITCVPIKRIIFDDRASAEDLVDHLKTAYLRNACDGLFLPAVCNRGVKLPITLLLNELSKNARVRFSLLDAAQAINHIGFEDTARTVDFTIAGTHKWLRAFEPMGMGMFSRASSSSFIQSMIERNLASSQLVDPLLNFTESLGTARETVNLQPLFAAQGALVDAMRARENASDQNEFRDRIIEIAKIAGWRPRIPHPDLFSRIVMAEKNCRERTTVGAIRKFMMGFGVAVSDFGKGQCRISTPDAFSISDQSQLQLALTKF